MLKKTSFIILWLALTFQVSAQPFQDFLEKVSANNPEITALRKLLEARRAEARTGYLPPDPVVSAGFMPGNTEAAGNKKTWTVSQSFDFPLKYLLQKKIGGSNTLLAEEEFRLGYMLIMLEAGHTLFDLIYTERSLRKLNERKEDYERLRSAWESMLENGEATIMDFNNVLLELSVVNLEISRKEAEFAMLKEKIEYMGGIPLNNAWIEEYPSFSVPGPDALLAERSASHPYFLIPELEYRIGNQELKLSRTGSLPSIQLGYTSEIVPDMSYTGPVAGLSVPLWNNSGRVRSASAAADHLEKARDAELLKLASETRRDYAEMLALLKSLDEIRVLLASTEGSKYPDRALEAGEISLAAYFNYLDLLYRTEDRLLELENEYNKALAAILDYRLPE